MGHEYSAATKSWMEANRLCGCSKREKSLHGFNPELCSTAERYLAFPVPTLPDPGAPSGGAGGGAA